MLVRSHMLFRSWLNLLLSYCGFSVFKVLDCIVCLFHVERLLHEVISLGFIPGRYNDGICFKQLKRTKTIWGLSMKMTYILFCLRILIAFCFTMFWKRKTTTMWWAEQRTTTILTLTQTAKHNVLFTLLKVLVIIEVLVSFLKWTHTYFSFTLPITLLNTPTFMVLLINITI